ncbi:MAG: hypothetical protein FWE70_03325 [Oscillospiraceae bacterium]|nr:hypothetical protein [Oscillospiraceae bacterium]
MKVLVADPSSVFRMMFRQAVAELGGGASATCVADADGARAAIGRHDYGVIVVDADLPGADPVALMAEFARKAPKAFRLFTASPSSVSGDMCARAVAGGASDRMAKPLEKSYGENLSIVRDRLGDILKAINDPIAVPKAPAAMEAARGRPKGPDYDLILIAASTGGPSALEAVLSKLAGDFPIPILIVQHMPQSFMPILAQNLSQRSLIKVRTASDGEVIQGGTAYLAPGGTHMRLSPANRIELDGSPPINGIRPAADVLFESVAKSYKGNGVMAVVLTGMGNDGEAGIASLKRSLRCHCLAQSAETCVVYGMPRAVIEGGLADGVLGLGDMASGITRAALAGGCAQ